LTTTDEPSDDDLDHAQAVWRVGVDGGDGAAMSALGALLAMRGDLDAAETWLRRAVESGVDSALFSLGRVLEMRGDHAAAGATYYSGEFSRAAS
jgi:TPR repeat protein